MRKILLLAGLALSLFPIHLQAQSNLNWPTCFTPAWENGSLLGTARNINGSSVGCRVSIIMNGPGDFVGALGNTGALTPTVLGSTFTIPGSGKGLQVTTDYTNATGSTDIDLTFTALVSNVSFKIADIDKDLDISTTYFDRVTITGSDGITTYAATVSRYDETTDPNFLVINRNSASVNTQMGMAGNSASDANDQRGTVIVSFGSTAINRIMIRYDNATGADADPAMQSIAIGNITFTTSTLPVHLDNFSGRRSGQDVLLHWTTQQELNVHRYEIERNQGAGWNTLGQVMARNNPGADATYTFTDHPGCSGQLLYRLKMIDMDQNHRYSGIVRIGQHDGQLDLLTYPNPFGNELSVNVNSPVAQTVLVLIYDTGGKTIVSESHRLNTGNNNFSLGTAVKIPAGIYHIDVRDEKGLTLGRSKLVKQ